jgi:transposase-like protein
MTISFARHHFPPAIIRHAVWLYVRFTLSHRDALRHGLRSSAMVERRREVARLLREARAPMREG